MASIDEVAAHVNDMVNTYERGELDIGIEEYQTNLLEYISDKKQSYEREFAPEVVVVDPHNRDRAGLIPADVHRSFRLAPPTRPLRQTSGLHLAQSIRVTTHI